MGNAQLKELGHLDLSLKTGKKKSANVQRAAAWKSTGIVALRDSGLMVIPDPVFALGPDVRSLDATNNKIERIPREGLGMLVSLQRLVLSNNLLSSLPGSVSSLTSLKILSVDSNRLQQLPNEVGCLTNLERLNASANSLQSLPDTIGRLRNLTVLEVSKNKLRTLPGSIKGCFALEEIHAQENELASLPTSLEELKNLTTLELDQNKLQALPPGLLTGCEKLRTISISGNPVSDATLQQMEGYDAFEERRKSKVDKQIAANVLMSK